MTVLEDAIHFSRRRLQHALGSMRMYDLQRDQNDYADALRSFNREWPIYRAAIKRLAKHKADKAKLAADMKNVSYLNQHRKRDTGLFMGDLEAYYDHHGCN